MYSHPVTAHTFAVRSLVVWAPLCWSYDSSEVDGCNWNHRTAAVWERFRWNWFTPATRSFNGRPQFQSEEGCKIGRNACESLDRTAFMGLCILHFTLNLVIIIADPKLSSRHYKPVTMFVLLMIHFKGEWLFINSNLLHHVFHFRFFF